MMGCFNNIGKPVDTRDKLGYVKSGILQVSVDCSPIIQPTHKQQPVVLHDRQFQLCPILFIATNFILHPMCIHSYVLPELAVLTSHIPQSTHCTLGYGQIISLGSSGSDSNLALNVRQPMSLALPYSSGSSTLAMQTGCRSCLMLRFIPLVRIA